MKRVSAVVAGVIYPGVEKYLPDYARSLLAQTDQEFDLMLINDGADPELRQLFPVNTIWLNNTGSYSPAKIRQLLMENARQSGYEQLIWTDSDDYFSNNRVAESKRLLKTHDFVFNELVVVDQSGTILQDKYLTSIKIHDTVSSHRELLDRNFIGLSNSALNLSTADGIAIPSTIIAVDWWIYSLLVIRGLRGKFLPEASTFYRQHTGNMIGLAQQLTVDSLRMGVSVKLAHYASLVNFGDDNGLRDVSAMAREALGQMQTLAEQIKSNTFCEHYINGVNDTKEFFTGWWSGIVPASTIKDTH